MRRSPRRCLLIAGQIKVLSIAVGLAALIGAPAQAITKKKTHAAGVVTSQTLAPIYGWAGQYRGTDPDPNIRFQLMRDQNLR
jgi:hypothetical protein